MVVASLYLYSGNSLILTVMAGVLVRCPISVVQKTAIGKGEHHFRQSHVTPTNTTHAGHVGMGFLTLAALLPPRPMSGKSDMDGGATSLHDKQDRVIDAGRQKTQPENSTVLTLTRKRDRF